MTGAGPGPGAHQPLGGAAGHAGGEAAVVGAASCAGDGSVPRACAVRGARRGSGAVWAAGEVSQVIELVVALFEVVGAVAPREVTGVIGSYLARDAWKVRIFF